ncbi:MAG: hypothetical protein JJT75_03680 [Opitutales bacterium]|nr:hypothetical protein [Opitutales bacterium]MCH8541066.1 hypothetical protein [Opitutales bacterium]
MSEIAAASREVLLRNARKGRLPHGILLSGPDLAQLEETALTLAGVILKSPEKPSGEISHPDLYHLRPAGRMRQISADDTRGLIKNLFQTAFGENGKVAIVHEADCFHQASSNIFLKTLEEPPDGTYIILISTRPYSLLATIRSRCLFFRLPGQEETTQESESEVWLEDFEAFLKSAGTPVQRSADLAPTLMQAYGLVVRFGEVLQNQVTMLKEKARDSVPEEDEAHKAWEKLMEIEARQKLLRTIAERCLAFARHSNNSAGQQVPLEPLRNTIQEIERANYLLQSNLQAGVAIEQILLTALRSWALHNR